MDGSICMLMEACLHRMRMHFVTRFVFHPDLPKTVSARKRFLQSPGMRLVYFFAAFGVMPAARSIPLASFA
jgi:hypothetical protein